jgi:hypothetical protein
MDSALHDRNAFTSGVPINVSDRQITSVSLASRPSFLFSFVLYRQVPQPAASRPTDDQFYVPDENGNRKPNGQFLKQHFFHEGRLTEDQALFILEEATALLAMEPNLVDVASPVTS